MKKLIFLLSVLLSICFNVDAAKQVVRTTLQKRPNSDSTANRVPAECPIHVTYDSDTWEIEVTGKDDDIMEIQIFDNWGNWYSSTASTPWTYKVTVSSSKILYVHIYAYEWEAVSDGIAISGQ